MRSYPFLILRVIVIVKRPVSCVFLPMMAEPDAMHHYAMHYYAL